MYNAGDEHATTPAPQRDPTVHLWKILVPYYIFLTVVACGADSSSFMSAVSMLTYFTTSAWDIKFGSGITCHAPAPNLFAYHPPRSSNEHIVKASKELDKYLSNRASKSDIDSISISIVTPAGPIFEGGYGLLKANETNADSNVTHPVSRDSIYRIASISKMFTVLETHILRERGALTWDDPVEKHLAEFNPPSYGWGDYLDGLDSAAEEKPRITLRQLASHLSGIGRDYPPGDIGEWPVSEVPKTNGSTTYEVKYDEVVEAVNKYPLVNLPYEYPVYSNTGMGLLGLANVAANKNASSDPAGEPQTHKELLQRDIFAPLGMTSSFFRVPADAALRAHMAVPSKDAEWADRSLGDASDSAGGQYSSLGDLAALMQTLLSPTARGGVVPANVVREWLRPLHTWGAGGQEVGAPWEITTLAGAKVYAKGGNLPGYHSEFALLPEHALGIVMLVTGEYADTLTLLGEAAKRFVAPVAKLHEAEVAKHYAGTWANGVDVAQVEVRKGALVLKKLVVRGVDVLAFIQSDPYGTGSAQRRADPVGLWTTGRPGEFRLAFGRPKLNNVRDVGCMPYWISLDGGSHGRGAPLDLVYWKNGVMHYPSSGVSFARKR